MPSTFLAVHDKTVDAKILYVSSGVRASMGFSPQDIVGSSIILFLADRSYAIQYRDMLNREGDENAMILMAANTKATDGSLKDGRAIVFNCDSCAFAVVSVEEEQPDISPMTQYIHPYRNALEYASRGEKDPRFSERISPPVKSPAIPENGQEKSSSAPFFMARASQPKACIILEKLTDEIMLPIQQNLNLVRNPTGPRITFVTNSISHIVSAESEDIVDLPFLRLVAPESIVTAGKFLEKLVLSENIAFATLFLLQTPSLSLNQERHPGTDCSKRVEIEIIGAQSDDGAMLFCRKVRVRQVAGIGDSLGHLDNTTNEYSEPGYLSLSEIISTDPETSDCPVNWSRIVHND